MTAPLAWLIDTYAASEMMRPRPEPRVASFLDSIAEECLGPRRVEENRARTGKSYCCRQSSAEGRTRTSGSPLCEP